MPQRSDDGLVGFVGEVREPECLLHGPDCIRQAQVFMFGGHRGLHPMARGRDQLKPDVMSPLFQGDDLPSPTQALYSYF